MSDSDNDDHNNDNKWNEEGAEEDEEETRSTRRRGRLRSGGGGGGRMSRKASALQRMRESKDRRLRDGISRTEEYDMPEEEDVYDVVEEDEYRSIVESRRKREDFVIDDDGLGYHDDGEEVVGYNREDEEGRKRKRRGANASLTAEALRSARRTKAAKERLQGETPNEGGDNDDGEISSKNKSMWDFVRKGPSAALSSRTKTTIAAPSGGDHLDSLLDELNDYRPATSSSHKRGTSHGRRTPQGAARRERPRTYGTVRGRPNGRHATQKEQKEMDPEPRSKRRYSPAREDASPLNFGDNNDDNSDNDDDNGVDFIQNEADSDRHQVSPSGEKEGTEAESEKCKSEGEKSTPESAKRRRVETEDGKEPNEEQREASEAETKGDEVTSRSAAPRRRVFGRSKLGEMSAPARALLERRHQKEPQAEPQEEDAAEKKKDDRPMYAIDTSSASFQQPKETIDAEGSKVSPEAAAAAAATFESVVRRTTRKVNKRTKEGEEKDEVEQSYLDMFWIDACEQNGVIYLFGKVKVDAPETSKDTTGKPQPTAASTFVSCCAIVKNNMRNLFVLPRTDQDGNESEAEEEEADGGDDLNQMSQTMMNAWEEMDQLLFKHCIPKVAGSSFTSKVVKRRYAFHDPTVPRHETKYLKIRYDAKYPSPPPEVCTQGGKNFSRILNANASCLETFLVKRKLMGPCWVRMYNPQSNTTVASSWCKLEFHMPNPKDVQRLDLALAAGEGGGAHAPPPPPPPPVVAVTLKMKTVLNHKTHKAEVVSVSAICHRRVMLDTSSDESTHHMTQLSLIRPLGRTAGAGGGGGMLQQFPRNTDAEIRKGMPQLLRQPNERALLNRLFTQIGLWDPDVLVGHNALGYDLEVLLSRCIYNKVPSWSKIGRRRRLQLPQASHFTNNKEMRIAEVMSGRILCDTYLNAREHLREDTYSLTHLALTQLKAERVEVDPVDVPQFFESPRRVVELARHTLHDAHLVQRLMFKLQALPLSKQLTCLAGNLWSKTIKGNRADRTEYLLLHEFHQLKYIPPEKTSRKRLGEGEAAGPGKGQAKYSGGLVLEPKRGLYDSFILLLDFNSLYPSIIQEYNLCFTTIDWADHHQTSISAVAAPAKKGGDESEDEGDAAGAVNTSEMEELPALPDESIAKGVLPRVIQTLVDRRRNVKKLMKSERNPEKKSELDIRQKALKLTANSMYGCLGFSNSRFYARPLAALVTSKGRETLQSAVEVAQGKMGLDVIYGDTDSIMINTRITDKDQLEEVEKVGEQVKREVNQLYKNLELDTDGVLRPMLLLKKKKYAAKTFSREPDGTIVQETEVKGLDLVRRDWCVQSKETGHFVLNQILSGGDSEAVLLAIHDHLEELGKRMREGQVPLEKFVITKGLSKHPNDYPDAKSQPHVHVAKIMLQEMRPVNVGDHIPYVITLPEEDEEDEEATQDKEKGDSGTEQAPKPPKKKPADIPVALRARHPDEVRRSGGKLKVDVEWYLVQQILPPVARLLEPIEGTSHAIIADKLGLDSTKYGRSGGAHGTAGSFGFGDDDNDDGLVDFTPCSRKRDSDRFQKAQKLRLKCKSCGNVNEYPGVFYVDTTKDAVANAALGGLTSGFHCPHSACRRPLYWGHNSLIECVSVIANATALLKRKAMDRYYSGTIQCDDGSCGLVTRQLSVAGDVCLAPGCSGRMRPLYNESDLHNQLEYHRCLFDIDHAFLQLEDYHPQLLAALSASSMVVPSSSLSVSSGKTDVNKREILKTLLPKDEVVALRQILHPLSKRDLNLNAYHWVGPKFFQHLFGGRGGAITLQQKPTQ